MVTRSKNRMMDKKGQTRCQQTAVQDVIQQGVSDAEQEPMAQWFQDLEMIFKKAMAEEKLNIALKAKELLAKSKGWLCGGAASTPRTIKTIDRWTMQEINDMILQLDGYQEDVGPKPESAVGPKPESEHEKKKALKN